MEYLYVSLNGKLSGRFLKGFNPYEGISSIFLARAILKIGFEKKIDLTNKFYVTNIALHKDGIPLIKAKDILKIIKFEPKKEIDKKELENANIKINEIKDFAEAVKEWDIQKIREYLSKNKDGQSLELITRTRKGRKENQLYTARELHIYNTENFGFIIGIADKDSKKQIIKIFDSLELEGFGGDKTETDVTFYIHQNWKIINEDTSNEYEAEKENEKQKIYEELFEEPSECRLTLGEHIVSKEEEIIGRIKNYNAIMGNFGASIVVARKGAIVKLKDTGTIVGENINDEDERYDKNKQIFPGKTLSIKVDDILERC